MSENIKEQERIRREKKKELEKLGINPYPSLFEKDISASYILENFKQENSDFYKNISIAGRIMSMRVMGSASFIEIKDEESKIQVYLQKESFEDSYIYENIFKKLSDIGDIVGIKGYVFITKVGVISIHANDFKILSKAIKPLPCVKEVLDGGNKKIYDSFSNPEARYRNRYIDLIVNSSTREIFIKRSKMMRLFRDILNSKGYLEVETPILQPIYGGAAARPFSTHHNTLDMNLYLRISPELYLKRLICGGFNGVFEIAKNFRNEGMSRFHNPEFSMLELYVAYKDYNWMMDFTENLIESIVKEINETTLIEFSGKKIDFKKPWKRYTLAEIIYEKTSIDILKSDEKELREHAKKLGIETDDSFGKAKIIDEIFGKECEPFLINPTFITDYPIEMSPLAKKKENNENYVERFELICNGKEICNAYSELNDPIDQRSRFEEQLNLMQKGDKEAMMLDEDFLNAIEHGMPPTAGLGIGLDRLAMIITNSHSIQEVIFFPQMRLENKN